MPSTAPDSRPGFGRLAPLLLFLVLAIAHTWPLGSAPHRLSLNHNADAQLNAWIVAWVAHTLPTAPFDLWRGNIFQPGAAAWTLSEPLLVPAVAGAPVYWASGSAVLTFNLLLIAGLAASGWAGWWAMSRWTGSHQAGLITGMLFVFNAHLLTRLPHLQAAHACGLWLIWIAAWTILSGGRAWWRLAVAVALTAATSLHWLVMGTMGAGLMLLARRPWPSTRTLIRVAGAGLAGIVCALPILWPHLTAGVRRPLEQIADFAATPAGYLTSLSHLHRGWSAGWFTAETNVWFPGVTALLLAFAGLGHVRRHPLARWAVLLIVVGLVLSLGPATPVYEWAYNLLPPVQGIRAASRFGMLALTGLAVLAGYGVITLLTGRSRPVATVLTAGPITIAGVEQWLAPVRTTPFTGVPAVYSLLRDEPEPVLLAEMPFYPPEAAFENGEYVLNATGHWRDVVNGYSGVIPAAYRRQAESLWYFPEPRAIAGLRQAGATHVMVHLERFGHEAAYVSESLQGHRDLRLIAADRDGHRLYRVVRE